MLKRSKKNAEGKVTLQGHRFYKFYPHSALNALYQNEESVFIDTCPVVVKGFLIIFIFTFF